MYFDLNEESYNCVLKQKRLVLIQWHLCCLLSYKAVLLEIKIQQDLEDIRAQHSRSEMMCLLVLLVKETVEEWKERKKKPSQTKLAEIMKNQQDYLLQ